MGSVLVFISDYTDVQDLFSLLNAQGSYVRTTTVNLNDGFDIDIHPQTVVELRPLEEIENDSAYIRALVST